MVWHDNISFQIVTNFIKKQQCIFNNLAVIRILQQAISIIIIKPLVNSFYELFKIFDTHFCIPRLGMLFHPNFFFFL